MNHIITVIFSLVLLNVTQGQKKYSDILSTVSLSDLETQDQYLDIILDDEKSVPLLKMSSAKDKSSTQDPTLNSKYVFTEPAYGLKKGEVAYQNILLFLNTFAFGISDNFTISSTIEASTLLSGTALFLIINPKYTFANNAKEVKFGIGSHTILYHEDHDTNLTFSLYGLVTLGSQHTNFTMGIGTFHYDGGFLEKSPWIQFGGVVRLTENFSLMFEGFNLSGGTIVLPAIRMHGINGTFDLGLTSKLIYGVVLPVAALSVTF